MNPGSIDSSNLSSRYQAVFEEMRSEIRGGAEAQQAEQASGVSAPASGLAASQVGLAASQSSAEATDGEAWRLPGVTGGGTNAVTMGEKAGWMAEISDSALMFNALWEMARSSQQDLASAKDIKNAMQTAKIDAKEAAINETQNQIEAERAAAWESFGYAVAGALVSLGVSLVGSGAGGFVEDKAWQAAWQASAQGWGSATTALGTAISKNSGYQRDADDAKLRSQRLEMQEAIFDDAVDTFKGSYEEAKEQMKLALRIIQEHFELQSQVVQKITS